MKSASLRTVLYVDDEPDIREIVQLALGLVDGAGGPRLRIGRAGAAAVA